MAERKTLENAGSVKDFLNAVKNARRRQDSLVVTKMMERVSRKTPKMWGPSIVGFGKHRYLYANGSEGEICKIGFAPRAQSLVFYLANFSGRAKYLKRLGKHKISRGGCIYVNKLDDVDLNVLDVMFEEA
jgi:hypothetical protein